MILLAIINEGTFSGSLFAETLSVQVRKLRQMSRKAALGNGGFQFLNSHSVEAVVEKSSCP